jgi:hypothetical protein
MDVLEGPLGEWLLEPERAGQTASALCFMGQYRQKIDAGKRMRREESQESSEDEFVVRSADTEEQRVVASNAHSDGKGGIADGEEGLSGVRQDADQKAEPASIERGVAQEKAAVLEEMAGLATRKGGKSERRADDGEQNNVKTGGVEDWEGGLSKELADLGVG